MPVGGCIEIQYTGTSASCILTASAAGKTLTSAIGVLGAEVADAAFGAAGVIDLTGATVDSLSELGNACMKMVIGGKPTAAPPDYGVAQNNLMNLLRWFTQGFKPTFILTCHVSRQANELTGAQTIMPKAIGRAMGDDIPQLFSEVLYCRREGVEWVWDTAAIGVTTKSRYLGVSSKLKPDIGTILDKWVKRSSV